MRYPLILFLFVFVIPPFIAHALLTGRAAVATSPGNLLEAQVATSDTTRIHNWTLAAQVH